MVDFLIIGTPKAGTTALQSYLKQHDEIFMPEVKELHFFGDEFRKQEESTNTPYQYNLGIKEYEDHFASARSKQIKGEASVFYLYSKSAIEQIRAYNSNMKIIVCFRNPVDFLVSYHQDLLYVENEDENDIWKALSLEDKRKEGKYLPPNCTLKMSLFYSEMVNYNKYLKEYIKAFGNKNVYPIIFEEFFSDPKLNLQCLLKFLEIRNPSDEIENFKKVNPRRNIRFKGLNSILRRPNKGLRSFAKVMVPSQKYRLQLYNRFRKLNTSYSKINKLSHEERIKLYKLTENHISELELLLGKNLSLWR